MKAVAVPSFLFLLLLRFSWVDAESLPWKPPKTRTRLSLRANTDTAIQRDSPPFLAPGGAAAAASIDKSTTWSFSDLRTIDAVYVGIHAALLATIVVMCRTMTRSGGRAPTWITDHLPDPYATGVLHGTFWALGLAGRSLLPPGLSRLFFAPPSVALLGTVFPALESVRAAVSDDTDDDRTWLMYWVIHGIFQYSTEFMDQLALASNFVYRYWHTFEVLVILWLILPITDGATLIYNTIAQPYLLPLVLPIKRYGDSWISALALTSINASYLWWFSFSFMKLPVLIQRYCVMGVGSIFPVAATVLALTASKDTKQVMRWLTYWPCFSLLFLSMIGVEKFVGSFQGLYVLCLAATLYLMLPMFDGSTLIFREVLVPLLGQQELLYLRDARLLAAKFFQHIPAHRQDAARRAAANAFVG